MSRAVHLSDQLFARVQAEADRRGVSVDHVLAELVGQLPVPGTDEAVEEVSVADWLEHARGLGPNHVGAPTGADLVAAARAEDDELVGR